MPTKAVTELQRLLTDDGDVKVSMSNGQIAFDLNKTLLVSKIGRASCRERVCLYV